MRRLLPIALLMLSLPVSARTLGSLEFTPCDIGQAGTGATARAAPSRPASHPMPCC